MLASKLAKASLTVGGLLYVGGCSALTSESVEGLPAEVAQKALEVGSQIGVQDGFGGPMMSGYQNHAPARMGFDTVDDLAAPGETLSVELTNLVDMPCNFHLKYLNSQIDLTEQVLDVTVGADETLTIEIPCSEIVGLGSLLDASQPAASTDDDATIPNPLAVPGFLGLEFQCGGRFAFVVQVDVDDLDEDGDVDEYIAISAALLMHMQDGGPGGHRHGNGMGMMGPHGMVGI